MSFKIAIASGKGGTGKTTVAVNLWHILSNDFGNKISLVDCDVEEPNDKLFFPESNTISNKEVKQIFPEVNEDNCVYCRKCAEYCEFNAIMVVPSAKYIQVSDELCHSCGACFYACEYDALKEVPMRVGAINQYRVTKDKILTEGSLDVGLPFQTPVIRELKKDTEDISDIILYDAPPGTSCSVVSTLTNTDLILL